MAIAFTGGSTKQQYNLKGGSADLFFRFGLTECSFTANNFVADTAQTAVATTLSMIVSPGWKRGDVLCVVRTGEKFYVDSNTSGAGPFLTVVVRAVDGTPAAAITVGMRIQKDGLAVRVNDATAVGSDDTLIVIDTVTASPDIVPSTGRFQLRRGYDQASSERIYVHTTSTVTDLQVKRNYNHTSDLRLDNNSAIADNEILFIVLRDFYLPEIESVLLTPSIWWRAECKDQITITPNFDTVELDSSERVDGSIANHAMWEIAFDNVIVQPRLIANMIPNLKSNSNVATAGVPEHTGISMETFFGEFMTGVRMYIKTRESVDDGQLQVFAYEATSKEMGEFVLTTEQRQMSMTFRCAHNRFMDSPGVIREPINC